MADYMHYRKGCWACKHALLILKLVPRVFSLSNMAAAGEKTLAHSRDHVTNLSTESRNLFKIAAPLLSPKRELLQTVSAAFHSRYFENGPLAQGIF